MGRIKVNLEIELSKSIHEEREIPTDDKVEKIEIL